ncbi:hypothetical protein C8Q77DRAFT_1158687 [Trametes polyzona]|nr:hypothetical protein C8Q77DRAFT_1158687 [Trametes polyzona]
MPFSAGESKLVSILVQSILYGIYVTLYVITTNALLWKRPLGHPVRSDMLSTSIVLFAIATMHIATNFSRIILAFIIHADAPGGPAAFFNELSNFTQMFGSTLLFVIGIPCILLLGSTVTGVGILYSFDKVVPEAPIFAIRLSRWITAFFSMTFSTNAICTALVSVRMWKINHGHSSFRHHRLRPVMVLIVESGAVYSATLLALLILYNVGSWFQYVVLDAVSPIVGIVFTTIILRIATGLSKAEGETALMFVEPVATVASGVQLSRIPSCPASEQKHTSEAEVQRLPCSEP